MSQGLGLNSKFWAFFVFSAALLGFLAALGGCGREPIEGDNNMDGFGTVEPAIIAKTGTVERCAV